jgi:hypothetical protein
MVSPTTPQERGECPVNSVAFISMATAATGGQNRTRRFSAELNAHTPDCVQRGKSVTKK